MKAELKDQTMPPLSECAQEWVGLPANAFGGVGDPSLPKRTMAQVRASKQKARAEYLASR
jgi:hypothetical protein